MALPAATPSAVPQTPAFVNMIGLFLSSTNQGTPEPSEDVAKAPMTTSTPAQIADSMIKSMLGGPSVRSTNLSFAVPQSMLNGTPSATTAPTCDSTIQSILSSLPSGSTNPTTPASNNDKAAAASADARKQPRNVADLPTLTVLVAPLPTPPTSAAPVATESSSTAVAQSTGTPQLPPATPLAAPLPKSAIAFTATLTPMKDVAAPINVPDSPRPVVAPPAAAAANAPSAHAPVASISTPAPTVQTQLSAPVEAEQNSSGTQTGGNMQQGGDNTSQNDSREAPEKVLVSADAKVKPAKDDDNGGAVSIQDRAPVVETALTSFPEQARTVTATQSATPAAAPTPFQSTAEALRTSEPNLPAAPQLRTGAVQEISIRIPQADSSTVDLRVIERAGQLHVDVRTSDGAMQTSLRQDLGTLTNSLQKAGYHSETFTPSSTLGRTASSAQTGNQDDQDPSQNRGGNGDSSEGHRQQQQQKRPSIWLEELEDQK